MGAPHEIINRAALIAAPNEHATVVKTLAQADMTTQSGKIYHSTKQKTAGKTRSK